VPVHLNVDDLIGCVDHVDCRAGQERTGMIDQVRSIERFVVGRDGLLSLTIFPIRSWAEPCQEYSHSKPADSVPGAGAPTAQFGQDPLIMDQVVAVSKCAEIRISGGL